MFISVFAISTKVVNQISSTSFYLSKAKPSVQIMNLSAQLRHCQQTTSSNSYFYWKISLEFPSVISFLNQVDNNLLENSLPLIKQVYRCIPFSDRLLTIVATEQEYVQVSIEEFDQLKITIVPDRYFQQTRFLDDGLKIKSRVYLINRNSFNKYLPIVINLQ